MIKTYRKTGHPQNAEQGQGWEETETADTLNVYDNTEGRTPILVVNVETEVSVRKYPVDVPKLIECIQNHRIMKIGDIAEKLNKPKTLVEHWFRKDKCFAIPDPDTWFQFKSMLGIETEEFDKSITTFETRAGKYDMQNRIHIGEKSPTLTASGENTMYCLPKVYDWHRCDTRMTELGDVCVTASATWGTGGNNMPMVDNGAVVRRLTPLECERLQGYPDGWTDIGEWTDSKGKKHKDADSPRYKALGNSIALPFWQWMAERMVKELDSEHPTMASLFDGIGGFPLVFSRCGCEPVWASEIEEFPIAVTKIRFKEGE